MISFFKNRKFVFSPFYTRVLLILFILFMALSFWQLYRAFEKEELQVAFEKVYYAAEADINNIGKTEDNLYRSVFVRGEYLKQGQILIDNIIRNRKPGYYVMSAFKYESGSRQRIIYVNRGWVPKEMSRHVIPMIDYPEGEIIIRGKISHARSKPVMIGITEDKSLEDGQVYLYFDKQVAGAKFGNKYEIDDLVIRLDPDDEWGFVREFPSYDAKVGMHYGYFVHWLVFAFFTIFIYFYVSFKKIDGEAKNEIKQQ